MQRQSESGVQFVNQTMDMLTIDWARVSIWAMTMASPSVSSSTATSWSAETVSEIDGEHRCGKHYAVLFCASCLQSALAGECARRRLVQGVFDVPLCAESALLMHRMNIGSTEDVSNLGEGLWH